jgi:FlaA1/EpsC-like NDP-sugar epimerase
VQLAAALRLVGNHSVELFLDDAPDLWRRDINGVTIQPPQILRERAAELDQVLRAIPTLSRSRRRQIVDALQEYAISVLQVPSVEELLGRDAVPPDPALLGPGIRSASVCVSGAGGSIGSALSRQILRLQPKRLVLLERSEPSLHAIH